MTSIATEYLARLRGNVEAWRAGDIDYLTFTAAQQAAWAAIRKHGPATVEAIVHALEELRTTATLNWMRVGHGNAPSDRTTGAGAPRFHNRPYKITIERCANGNQVLHVAASSPTSELSRHVAQRARSAFIYELAADLERRSQGLGVRWIVWPDVVSARVTIVASHDERALAAEIVASVRAELA